MNTTLPSKDRIAIVTGASSGIGLAIARALLAHGYRIVANARSIRSSGVLDPSPRCTLVDGDVADPELGPRLAQAALDLGGRIDLLVNNAGIFVPGDFHTYPVEDYRRIVATNADGFFFVTQPVVRAMLRQDGGGHVVSISTSLAAQPIAGVNAFGTYFTKGGINTVTRSLAIEYAGSGIRFNAIGAGIIDTPMHAPESHERLRQLHPIKRLGSVDEIVDTLLYLERAGFVTGEVIHVDGGTHAGR